MASEKKMKISVQTLFDKGMEKFISALDRGINKAKAFGNALRSGLHSAPVRMLRNALAGLVGTLAAGVMQAAKFNVELARAHTMTNQGIGWFKKMRDELREMSAELGVAKDQLSGGLYQALSAGVPEDNVLSFLATAAKIAVADGSDVATAVDGMSTVLNAFKIEASETDRVADQMFNTVANGKTTFAELAHHMATAAPIAAANGVAFEEVLAAAAALTKQGTPTAQAMTQIRAAITSTTKVLGDNWRKTMTFQEALEKVSELAGGSQNALRKLVGELEAYNGITGLTGINQQAFTQSIESTAHAAGKMETAFQKVDRWRHWPKLWESIKGLVERTAQEADSRLAPAVLRIVEEIAELQDNDDLWNGLTDALDKAEEKITGIVEFIKSGGGEAHQEVLDAVGQFLKGAAMNAGEAGVEVILKAGPAIGRAIGHAAKDAIWGDSTARIAKHRARSAANQEFGVKDELVVIPRGGSYIKDDPKKRTPEYKQRLEQLEQEELQKLLREQGVDLVGQLGTGAGSLEMQAALSRLNKFSVGGSEIKTQREQREAAVQAEQERQSAARAQYDARKEELFGAAKRGYGNLQERIVRDKQDVANASLYGSKGDLEAAQSKLQADQQLAGQIALLANNIKNGTGMLQAASMALLQSIIDQQNSQQQQIEMLKSQIRTGRS